MKHKEYLAGVVLFGLFGCAPLEVYTLENSPEYMTVKKTPFFLHGPKQPGPPDVLKPQTFVKLQRKEYGYSVIQLDDGRSGYIATDDMRKAPPTGRAVNEDELFPQRRVESTFVLPPEPDFSLPVEEVTASEEPKSKDPKPE